MIKVGITGGIGSGKSLICEVFYRLGVPVHNADNVARWLCETDPQIRAALISLLGNDLYNGKSIDRSRMSALIFTDKSMLQQVNQIIHPKVAEHFENWGSQYSDRPYIVQESAILFESGFYLMFDRYITVTAPEEVRIQRIISRAGMTAEKIATIMQNQLPESEKARRSHHVIINDGLTPVLPQVLQLHHAFLSNEYHIIS
jgi:dephospho-CoA kinase